MQRRLQIAELVLGLESNGLPWGFGADSPHWLFEVDSKDDRLPSASLSHDDDRKDVSIQIHWRPFEGEDLGQALFSVTNASPRLPPTCRLFRDSRGYWRIETNEPRYQVFGRRVAVLSPDWERGDLYVELKPPPLPVYPNPFCSPVDRVLFANLLARQCGMLVHACGVVHEGRGYLFAGPSGAGKTTLARLWSEWDDATVLGEECLALRARGPEMWLYGTPWIGESRSYSRLGAPLAAVYFLQHASENRLRRVPVERAVERLLVRSFLPTYDPEVTRQVLDFCLRTVSAVPVYEFGFRPDASAVEFVRMAAQRERPS